jgi:hypothetical protein
VPSQRWTDAIAFMNARDEVRSFLFRYRERAFAVGRKRYLGIGNGACIKTGRTRNIFGRHIARWGIAEFKGEQGGGGCRVSATFQGMRRA